MQRTQLYVLKLPFQAGAKKKKNHLFRPLLLMGVFAMARKVAVGVSQNNYASGTDVGSLRGCANDALSFGEMLKKLVGHKSRFT
jgi:hypothetical protein